MAALAFVLAAGFWWVYFDYLDGETEYGRYGVRFNVVCPGSIRTPAVEGLLTEEELRRDEVTTPLQRAGRPDDIAKAVLFFASELAEFVTGQTLVVDGGATVRFPLPSPGADPSESLV